MTTFKRVPDSQLDRIERTLYSIERKVQKMAVDQATFDAALTDFTNDLQAGLDAIAAKLASLGNPVDLTAELATITAAKATLDAAVAADTGTPAG